MSCNTCPVVLSKTKYLGIFSNIYQMLKILARLAIFWHVLIFLCSVKDLKSCHVLQYLSCRSVKDKISWYILQYLSNVRSPGMPCDFLVSCAYAEFLTPGLSYNIFLRSSQRIKVPARPATIVLYSVS